MVSGIAPIVDPWRTVAVNYGGHLDWRIVVSGFFQSQKEVFGI